MRNDEIAREALEWASKNTDLLSFAEVAALVALARGAEHRMVRELMRAHRDVEALCGKGA